MWQLLHSAVVVTLWGAHILKIAGTEEPFSGAPPDKLGENFGIRFLQMRIRPTTTQDMNQSSCLFPSLRPISCDHTWAKSFNRSQTLLAWSSREEYSILEERLDTQARTPGKSIINRSRETAGRLSNSRCPTDSGYPRRNSCQSRRLPLDGMGKFHECSAIPCTTSPQNVVGVMPVLDV